MNKGILQPFCRDIVLLTYTHVKPRSVGRSYLLVSLDSDLTTTLTRGFGGDGGIQSSTVTFKPCTR